MMTEAVGQVHDSEKNGRAHVKCELTVPNGKVCEGEFNGNPNRKGKSTLPIGKVVKVNCGE